ncbi:MAG: hypothetical protein ABJA80_00440 [bacterium]
MLIAVGRSWDRFASENGVSEPAELTLLCRASRPFPHNVFTSRRTARW